MTVRLKRAYEPPARGDVRRILIDRRWPRGCPRNSLRIDALPRKLAPSDAFRRWFAHDPGRWQDFRRRYQTELRAPEMRELLRWIAARARRRPVTLVYAARDKDRNSVVVVAGVLERLVRFIRAGKSA